MINLINDLNKFNIHKNKLFSDQELNLSLDEIFYLIKKNKSFGVSYYDQAINDLKKEYAELKSIQMFNFKLFLLISDLETFTR